MRRLGYVLTLVMAIALSATAGFAQDGKLKIKVTPKQAYVFVDGNAIREGSHSISLSLPASTRSWSSTTATRSRPRTLTSMPENPRRSK